MDWKVLTKVYFCVSLYINTYDVLWSVLGSASTEPIVVRNMANKFEHAIWVDDVDDVVVAVVAVVVDDDAVGVVGGVVVVLSNAPVAAVPVFIVFFATLAIDSIVMISVPPAVADVPIQFKFVTVAVCCYLLNCCCCCCSCC